MTATLAPAAATMAAVTDTDRSVPASAPAPALRTRHLTRRFGEVVAVDAVDLEVRAGEFLGVLGPSGCGKTTLLRLVVGFERPDAGEIEVGGAAVAGPRRMVPPERRRVGMVFQESALFPHLDVAGNIGFGLPRQARRARVEDLAALVGLSGLGRRMPHELSGGQQQRVALARALAPNPALVLLDEPFSSLDATLRADLRREVREILRAARATAVFVTHDQSEALELGDRVAVMRSGRIEQVATPDELYLRPINRFVAGFVGEANFLPGEVRDGEVETAVGRFRPPRGALADGTRVEVLLRPEQIHMVRVERVGTTPPIGSVLTVARRVFHGSQVHHVLEGSGGLVLEATTPSSVPVEIGTRVVAHARARHVPVYPLSADGPALTATLTEG